MQRRAALVIAVLACAAPARADAPDPETLVKAGIALRREHRDADALDRFRRAYAITPTARIEAQIALAEQALGRWADAERDLDAAMARTTDAWIVQHLEVLRGAHAAVEERLGWLDVLVDVPGGELIVNGESRGTLPLASPIRVEAGSLVVDVQHAGYATARRMTLVEPGGTARETIHLEPIAPPPAVKPPVTSVHPSDHGTRVAGHVTTASPPRASSARSNLRSTAVVFIGAAIADVAIGSYFGVRTLQAKSDRDAQCGATTCTPLGVAYDGEARSFALRSTAWFGAGVVFGTTGALLWWVSRSRATSVGIAPWVGPERAGGSVEGSF